MKSVKEVFEQVSIDMKDSDVSKTIQSTDNVAVCYWGMPFLSKPNLIQGFSTVSGRQLQNDKKESAVYKASYNIVYDKEEEIFYI